MLTSDVFCPEVDGLRVSIRGNGLIFGQMLFLNCM